MAVSDGRFRTLAIGVLLLAAGLALVVLATVDGPLAAENSRRVEGAFAVLLPAFFHSLVNAARARGAERTGLERGDALIAAPLDLLGSPMQAMQPGTAPLAGTVIGIEYRSGELEPRITIDHGNGDRRVYPAIEVFPMLEREPTGGHPL